MSCWRSQMCLCCLDCTTAKEPVCLLSAHERQSGCTALPPPSSTYMQEWQKCFLMKDIVHGEVFRLRNSELSSSKVCTRRKLSAWIALRGALFRALHHGTAVQLWVWCLKTPPDCEDLNLAQWDHELFWNRLRCRNVGWGRKHLRLISRKCNSTDLVNFICHFYIRD